jgi:hypothetical protein
MNKVRIYSYFYHTNLILVNSINSLLYESRICLILYDRALIYGILFKLYSG